MPLVQFDRPVPAPTSELQPADALRTFVFMANLAAQEASGDPAASTSIQRVLVRMKGSSESDTVLLGLADSAPPLAELSPVGLPLVPSSAHDHEPELSYRGFVHVGFNLQEERHIAECECVLDVELLPLPGEPFSAEGESTTHELYEAAEWLGAQQGRSIMQTGLLHSSELTPEEDPQSALLLKRGYVRKLAETQVVHDVKHDSAQIRNFGTARLRFTIAEDYDIPNELVDGVLELLTVASEDAPRDELSFEKISWTRKRLTEAAARQRDRNAHTILVIASIDSVVVCLAELSRHAGSNPEVAEWSLIVTGREHRKNGIASATQDVAMRELAERWPDVQRIYANHVTSDKAITSLLSRYGARVLSHSTVWEKPLTPPRLSQR